MGTIEQTIILDSVMDLITAGKLKAQLVEAADSYGKITIDGEKVDRILSPCIQLLVVADQEISKNNEGLKLINASDEMVEALKDIGLEKEYDKWSSY
tara:strand:- start:567 stop:857 length:291 start_codon:yes stop_codon:yes gene_type:complete